MDVYIARIERQEKKSWLIIHLEQMLKNGTVCEVHILYNGNLVSDENTGLYRSTYPGSREQL